MANLYGHTLDVMVRRCGIIDRETAVICYREAADAGIWIALGASLLVQESGGGHNVFGHDPTIYVGAGTVTRERYQGYKRERGTPGRHMQGVGPCQLTWWETQDEADRLGGCWKRDINMRVGFRDLAALIHSHGSIHEGLHAYNGMTAAGSRYATEVLDRAERFRHWMHDPKA